AEPVHVHRGRQPRTLRRPRAHVQRQPGQRHIPHALAFVYRWITGRRHRLSPLGDAAHTGLLGRRHGRNITRRSRRFTGRWSSHPPSRHVVASIKRRLPGKRSDRCADPTAPEDFEDTYEEEPEEEPTGFEAPPEDAAEQHADLLRQRDAPLTGREDIEADPAD